MIIKLNKKLANILMNEVENTSSLIIKQKELTNNLIEIEVSDIEEIQLLINDEIVLKGLNNQDTVNSYGKRLYELYDEIYYQRYNSN